MAYNIKRSNPKLNELLKKISDPHLASELEKAVQLTLKTQEENFKELLIKDEKIKDTPHIKFMAQEQRIKELERDLQEQKNRADQMKNERDKYERDRNANFKLTQRITELKENLTDITTKSIERNEHIEKLERNLKDLKETEEEMKEQINKLKTDNTEKESCIDEMDISLLERIKEFNTLQKNYQDLQSDYQRLKMTSSSQNMINSINIEKDKNKIEELNNIIYYLQKEYEETKYNLNAQISSTKKIISDLQRQLSSTTENNNLNSDDSKKDMQIAQLKEEIKSLRMKCKKLEDELSYFKDYRLAQQETSRGLQDIKSLLRGGDNTQLEEISRLKQNLEEKEFTIKKMQRNYEQMKSSFTREIELYKQMFIARFKRNPEINNDHEMSQLENLKEATKQSYDQEISKLKALQEATKQSYDQEISKLKALQEATKQSYDQEISKLEDLQKAAKQSYHQDINKLKNDIDDKEAERMLLQGEIALVKSQNREIAIRHVKLKNNIDDKEIEIASLKQKIKYLEDITEDIVNNYKSIIKKQKLEEDAMKNEISDLTVENSILTKQRNSLEIKFKDMQKELLFYKTEAHNLKHKGTPLSQEEFQKLKDELQEKKQQVVSLQANLSLKEEELSKILRKQSYETSIFNVFFTAPKEYTQKEYDEIKNKYQECYHELKLLEQKHKNDIDKLQESSKDQSLLVIEVSEKNEKLSQENRKLFTENEKLLNERINSPNKDKERSPQSSKVSEIKDISNEERIIYFLIYTLQKTILRYTGQNVETQKLINLISKSYQNNDNILAILNNIFQTKKLHLLSTDIENNKHCDIKDILPTYDPIKTENEKDFLLYHLTCQVIAFNKIINDNSLATCSPQDFAKLCTLQNTVKITLPRSLKLLYPESTPSIYYAFTNSNELLVTEVSQNSSWHITWDKSNQKIKKKNSYIPKKATIQLAYQNPLTIAAKPKQVINIEHKYIQKHISLLPEEASKNYHVIFSAITLIKSLYIGIYLKSHNIAQENSYKKLMQESFDNIATLPKVREYIYMNKTNNTNYLNNIKNLSKLMHIAHFHLFNNTQVISLFTIEGDLNLSLPGIKCFCSDTDKNNTYLQARTLDNSYIELFSNSNYHNLSEYNKKQLSYISVTLFAHLKYLIYSIYKRNKFISNSEIKNTLFDLFILKNNEYLFDILSKIINITPDVRKVILENICFVTCFVEINILNNHCVHIEHEFENKMVLEYIDIKDKNLSSPTTYTTKLFSHKKTTISCENNPSTTKKVKSKPYECTEFKKESKLDTVNIDNIPHNPMVSKTLLYQYQINHIKICLPVLIQISKALVAHLGSLANRFIPNLPEEIPFPNNIPKQLSDIFIKAKYHSNFTDSQLKDIRTIGNHCYEIVEIIKLLTRSSSFIYLNFIPNKKKIIIYTPGSMKFQSLYDNAKFMMSNTLLHKLTHLVFNRVPEENSPTPKNQEEREYHDLQKIQSYTITVAILLIQLASYIHNILSLDITKDIRKPFINNDIDDDAIHLSLKVSLIEAGIIPRANNIHPDEIGAFDEQLNNILLIIKKITKGSFYQNKHMPCDLNDIPSISTFDLQECDRIVQNTEALLLTKVTSYQNTLEEILPNLLELRYEINTLNK